MDFEPPSTDIWKFERTDPIRVDRLTTPPNAFGLLERLSRQANAAFSQSKITLRWEKFRTHHAQRAWAQIPIDKYFIDKLFNGRYGYRAQFYHGPETGNAYNKCAVDNLENVLLSLFEQDGEILDEVDMFGNLIQRGVSVKKKSFQRSMLGSESEVWLPIGSFEVPLDGYLDIQRWRRNGKLKGVLIPLPENTFVDFKGTFFCEELGEEIQNIPLGPRSEQIFQTGHT